MTSYSALSPVSAGIYAALHVAAVLALATGGVGDDIGQGTGYPFVLFEVHEKALGGFGTKPGHGQLPQIDLLLLVFSQYGGLSEAQAVMDVAIGALFLAFDPVAPTVTIAGYATCSLFHDETINLGDQIVAGIKVKELDARFRLFVEAP